MKVENLEKYSSLSLRFGLAIVLFWFSVKQFLNPSAWTGLVPSGISQIIDPVYIIYLNVNLEIILGTLLILGLFTRVASLVLLIHLIPIILSLGIDSPSAIRDVGLLFAALALALSGSNFISIDSIIKKRKEKNKK
ncbi:MAG TPA: DoxX family membrane protein [Candidatus Nanoarchaeia archaeon]|nr:DoxX family membrane protein [Candidatus Nanoarchaeia archaeon]